jgi:hypothetical protein
MSGKEATWTPQRREAQRERMRAQNADREFTRKRVEGLRASPKHKAHLSRQMVKRWATPWRARKIGLIKRNAALPSVKAIKAQAARAMQDRRRGRVIPAGYEATYRYLRKRVGAKEAMRMVLAKRAVDLRFVPLTAGSESRNTGEVLVSQFGS